LAEILPKNGEFNNLIQQMITTNKSFIKMKKIILLLSLMTFAFSFGQTKKNKVENPSLNTVDSSKIKAVKHNNEVYYTVDSRPIISGDPDYNEQNSDIKKTIKDEKIDDNTIYEYSKVEVNPDFPEGLQNFFTFINKNIKISDNLKAEKIKGKVYVQFVIEKNGSISNIKILRDLGFDSGKVVINVLKTMPKWIPAQNNGKKVRCSFAVPINIDTTKP
jgi:hypothetical protein